MFIVSVVRVGIESSVIVLIENWLEESTPAMLRSSGEMDWESIDPRRSRNKLSPRVTIELSWINLSDRITRSLARGIINGVTQVGNTGSSKVHLLNRASVKMAMNSDINDFMIFFFLIKDLLFISTSFMNYRL